MISTYSDIQIVLKQIQIGRLFLGRPVIQWQLAAFMIVVLSAWGLSGGLWKLEGKRLSAWGSKRLGGKLLTYWQYGLLLLQYSAFPLLSLAITDIVTRLFLAQGLRVAFITTLSLFFWFLLVYRFFVALLYMILGEKYMSRYHTLLLTPLFGLFSAYWLLNNFISISILARFEVLKLFGNPMTLKSLFMTPVMLYFLFYTSHATQDLLQEIIIPRTGVGHNAIHAVLTIGRYIVITSGVIIIAVLLGANMSTLAFISGGLSVGIGFGLQQIVANFLSGILLLFEQTLRPGDVIDVNGEMGVVEKLSIRSTTMRTPSNIEIIVPNENLLTSSVRTYTKNNRLVRISLTVGASYNSDPHEVREVLLEAARQHTAVLKNPKPIVFFKEFGASSIDFQLAVWLDEPMLVPRVTSELYFIIWDEFSRCNIEIPFPQRDLHIRSAVPWETFAAREKEENPRP